MIAGRSDYGCRSLQLLRSSLTVSGSAAIAYFNFAPAVFRIFWLGHGFMRNRLPYGDPGRFIGTDLQCHLGCFFLVFLIHPVSQYRVC